MAQMKLITAKQRYAENLQIADATRKVLFWFFAYPNKEISLTDLATNTGISKTTANTIVTLLVEEKFLIKEVIGKVWRLKCDITHPYNFFIKIPYNLEQIYTSGIIDEIHKSMPSTKNITLFGSYRKGDDIDTSDIDVAVEITDAKKIQVIPFGVLETIGYRKNVQVNLHLFSRNNIDINLFNNIANGIVLEGFLEVKP